MCVRFVSLALALCFSLSAFGTDFISTLDFRNGVAADRFASGRINAASSDPLAIWQLNSTVGDTDFFNSDVEAGRLGIQYAMWNPIARSTDLNQVQFTTIPLNPQLSSSEIIGLKLSQSVYEDEGLGWNGGFTSTANFVATWDESNGPGLLYDPDDQILNHDHGALVRSPAVIQYSSNQVFNTEDSWSLSVPDGDVGVTWSSDHQEDGTPLGFEWISFTPIKFARYDVLNCDGDGDGGCQLNDLAQMYAQAGQSVPPFSGFDFDGDGVVGSGHSPQQDSCPWLAT